MAVRTRWAIQLSSMNEPKLVLFCECADTAEAMALQARLLEAGVDAQLRNEALPRRVPRCASQVWVASDQMDKAAKIAALPETGK